MHQNRHLTQDPTVGNTVELLLGVYPHPTTMDWVFKSLNRLQQEKVLCLGGTAALRRTSSGELRARQIADWAAHEQKIIDGLTAALVALFNPAGSLDEIALNTQGALVHHLVKALAQMGLTREFLQTLSEEINDQASVLIVLSQQPWKRILAAEMSHQQSCVICKRMVLASNLNLDEHLLQLAQALKQEPCFPHGPINSSTDKGFCFRPGLW